MGSYLKDRESADFIAELTYKSALEGGRQGPAFSGYRPHVKFPFSDCMTSGQQLFLDKEIVYPGESVTAMITIIDQVTFEHTLQKGQEFEFGEGPRVIGTGIVTEVLNKKLEKSF